MTVAGLLEKGGDADFLKDGLTFALRRLMGRSSGDASSGCHSGGLQQYFVI